MNRLFPFLILLLTSTQLISRDYTARKLYELAINADKIVYGTINQINSNKLTLKIEGSLTGEKDSISFNIPEYGRDNYEIGQRVIVFLEYWGRDLEVMTFENEGEMPIIDDTVYIGNSTLPYEQLRLKPSTPTIELIQPKIHHYRIWNSNYVGMKLSFGEFLDVIQQIRDCFMFDYGTYQEPITHRLIRCPMENLNTKNELIRWVTELWDGKHER